MKAVLITPDDPFYLGESLKCLLSILPEDIEIQAQGNRMNIPVFKGLACNCNIHN